MELFIILLIFGYYKFIKGVAGKAKRKTVKATSPKKKNDHPYAPYRQMTFEELVDRAEVPAVHYGEGEDPCHGEEFTRPRTVKPLEGVDPCHDTMFTRPERILPQEESQTGWKPDLSPEGLRQAVVMQEVLARPRARIGRFGR